jgi:hypothetical protein
MLPKNCAADFQKTLGLVYASFRRASRDFQKPRLEHFRGKSAIRSGPSIVNRGDSGHHKPRYTSPIPFYAAGLPTYNCDNGPDPPNLTAMRWRTDSEYHPNPLKTSRRKTCVAILNVFRTAQPIVARSVRENSGSSGTTPGEPLSVRRSALTAPGSVERTIVVGCADCRPLETECGATIF